MRGESRYLDRAKSNSPPSWMPARRLARHDDHRAGGVFEHVFTDAAGEQMMELAVPMRAEDNQVWAAGSGFLHDAICRCAVTEYLYGFHPFLPCQNSNYARRTLTRHRFLQSQHTGHLLESYHIQLTGKSSALRPHVSTSSDWSFREIPRVCWRPRGTRPSAWICWTAPDAEDAVGRPSDAYSLEAARSRRPRKVASVQVAEDFLT